MEYCIGDGIDHAQPLKPLAGATSTLVPDGVVIEVVARFDAQVAAGVEAGGIAVEAVAGGAQIDAVS